MDGFFSLNDIYRHVIENIFNYIYIHPNEIYVLYELFILTIIIYHYTYEFIR